MARKEKKSAAWLKRDRVGQVTLFVTKRSPYWWMYWTEPDPDNGKRNKEIMRSTRETDLSLARMVAVRKSEELFTKQRFPENCEQPNLPVRFDGMVFEFVRYLDDLGRSYEHTKNIKGRLMYLARWIEERRLKNVQDVTPDLLERFQIHLRKDRALANATVNHYIDAVHNFFGYALYKRRVITGNNPAATGRQAVLDKLPSRPMPPPTLYPDQINAIIAKAVEAGDLQIANMIAFVCEGGFRFQEMQFLQVGDLNLEGREIVLDIKRPDPERVRPWLRKAALTRDGYWMPKSTAGRRIIHITDRLDRVISRMGLGDPSDWVFMNQAGRQVAESKTLARLKRYALAAGVLVEPHPRTKEPWSLVRWHWLRHYHRTRAHVSQIRREVSKMAMGHAADAIHDRYRRVDSFAFHEEYAKFDSGIEEDLFKHPSDQSKAIEANGTITANACSEADS
jgi:site-specific recombinase XerD